MSDRPDNPLPTTPEALRPSSRSSSELVSQDSIASHGQEGLAEGFQPEALSEYEFEPQPDDLEPADPSNSEEHLPRKARSKLSQEELQRAEDSLRKVLGAGGALAQKVEGYEEREQQITMALAVYKALMENAAGIVEAGTGTGKTLAYLIPALLAGKRVVISTATKALQEQLVEKDLPLLRKLGANFSFALMKGRQNYLCLHRMEHFEAAPEFNSRTEMELYPSLREWAAKTETGDRAELNLPENYSAWKEVSSTSENCIGQECPRWNDCFVVKMRQRAQEADFVVVNHHLYFADLALKAAVSGAPGVEIIPSHEAVIFDEAHKIEETATEFFGEQISNFRFFDLCRDLERSTKEKSDWPDDVISDVCKMLIREMEAFFRSVSALAPVDESTSRSPSKGRSKGPGSPAPDSAPLRLPAPAAIGSLFDPIPAADASREMSASDDEVLSRSVVVDPDVASPRGGRDLRWALSPDDLKVLAENAADLLAAIDQVRDLIEGMKEEHGDAELDAYLRRVQELDESLRVFARPPEANLVYWAEQRGRGVFLRAAPVDISSTLARLLFSGEKAVILTSATLATGGNTRFLQSRVGLRFGDELRMEILEEVLSSPFDFSRQASLYLPRHLEEPNAPNFLDRAVEELAALIALAQGRTFALFTSTRAMNEAHSRLAHRIPYQVLLQGEKSKKALLADFRREPSVLFATQSFWEGVDVQGDALSMVVIDKLPFASPGDPLVAARLDHIKARGGSPFSEYQMPSAAIALKQGFGRLIRSQADTGTVAILDKRLWTKSYGSYFRRSLPQCPTFSRFPDLKHWWREVRRE